jgi:GTPase involved in cell partitioning and DNA repair
MPRKYSRSASKDVEREMHEYKKGTLRSGKGGKGGKVKSRAQAIAIGLSEARRKGKKVPTKRGSSGRTSKSSSRSSGHTTKKR